MVATVVVVIVEGTYESVWTMFPLWSRTNAVSPSLFQIAPPAHQSRDAWSAVPHPEYTVTVLPLPGGLVAQVVVVEVGHQLERTAGILADECQRIPVS